MEEKDNKPDGKVNDSAFPSIDLNVIRDQALASGEKNIEPDKATASLANRLKQLDQHQNEATPYHIEGLATMLEKVMELVHLPLNPSILYPGSNIDTTVADVFGKDHVLHLDLDSDAMQKLADENYQAVVGSSETFSNGQQYDLVVFWNSGITPDIVLDTVKVGGYVFANNHHGSASIISTKNNFELIGGIDQNAPIEIKDATEMQGSLSDSYMEVTREAKIIPLSKQEYETAKLSGDSNILRQKNGEDSLFVFRKISDNT